jgi:hypothetical protein
MCRKFGFCDVIPNEKSRIMNRTSSSLHQTTNQTEIFSNTASYLCPCMAFAEMSIPRMLLIYYTGQLDKVNQY